MTTTGFFVCFFVFFIINLPKFIYIYQLFLRCSSEYFFFKKDIGSTNTVLSVIENDKSENISVLLRSLSDGYNIPLRNLEDDFLNGVDEINTEFFSKKEDFFIEDDYTLASFLTNIDNNYYGLLCTFALFTIIYLLKVNYFSHLVIYKVERYQGLDICYYRQGSRTLFVEIMDSNGNVEIEWISW